MAYTSHGDFLNASDKLVVAAKTNEAKAAPVDELRVQLEKEVTGIREAQARRNFHKAEAQQASRDFDNGMGAARKIYSRLRHMLIGLFGLSAEKLAEFGLQVFRPPQVSLEKKLTRIINKKRPPENGVEPTRTADSQIDSAS
jgi:hypothetical protein